MQAVLLRKFIMLQPVLAISYHDGGLWLKPVVT